VRIEPAAARDLASICALLRASDLPTDGIAEHVGTTLVARGDDGVVGCVALGLYGDAALLRSLAVEPSRRGTGLGCGLVEAALSLGRQSGVETLCLLTTTAPDFFARHFAFRRVARDEVPASVRRSIEFVSACPTTAQAMLFP